MDMIAVTTFPPWAWDVYAEEMVTSFLKFWPIPLRVYYESPPPLSHDRLGVRPLDDIKERTEFLNFDGPKPPEGYEDHYMFGAKKFCHKVFAQLDALKDNDRVIWLDADVVTHKTVPMKVVDFISSAELTYLGREGSYTETGFVGFNNASGQIDDFIARYWNLYRPSIQDVYGLHFWTDCHAFDYARNGEGHNLTPEGRGVDSVFEVSPLGEYAKHHKGNRKFKLGGASGTQI